MGVSERKEREKLEMQKLILDAARELFMRDGYENVSIRKIAEKIEYSPGTIYLYYKNKSEIFFVLCFLAFDSFYEEQKKTDNITDPIQKLKESGRIYINFAIQNPEFFELMFHMKAPLDKYYDKVTGDVGSKSFRHLEDIIDECMKSGYFKGFDKGTATISSWAFVHGLATLYNKERLGELTDKQRDTLIENALELYTRTIPR